VEAVIFDWGGTITPWHTVDLRAQWDTFAEGMGALACSRFELASAIFAAEEVAWRRGREEHTSARLHDVLAAVGLDPDDAATQAGLAAYRSFWEPHTWTHPHIEPLWRTLREEGLRVGVLSNTIWTRDYHREIFVRDGVEHLIDGDVYSSETPWVKPHPAIFRAAAEAVGVDPVACVYVGDRHFEDVHGPQSVGMRAIWVPHSDIPQDQQVSVEVMPDGIAHELSDVWHLVSTWR
jgi:putative hydrolase of the HAD superfamily